MNRVIESAVKSGHGNAVIIAGFAGLVLSDIIPTPGDALYFWDQRRLKRKLELGQITARQYWLKNAAGYYLYNSAWWGIVFGAVMLSKGSFSHKLKLGIGLAGSGAVMAVIHRNIINDKKDEKQSNIAGPGQPDQRKAG
jgi:hypothetical protein